MKNNDFSMQVIWYLLLLAVEVELDQSAQNRMAYANVSCLDHVTYAFYSCSKCTPWSGHGSSMTFVALDHNLTIKTESLIAACLINCYCTRCERFCVTHNTLTLSHRGRHLHVFVTQVQCNVPCIEAYTQKNCQLIELKRRCVRSLIHGQLKLITIAPPKLLYFYLQCPLVYTEKYQL